LDIDDGTLPRITSPEPGSVGATASTEPPHALPPPLDAEIEDLELGARARRAAYALKKAHPSITFTSGRRGKQEQAAAMAANVVENRRWIEQTYAASAIRTRCQDWIDGHPDAKSADDIADGLRSVLDAATDKELAYLSRHLSGDAFDI